MKKLLFISLLTSLSMPVMADDIIPTNYDNYRFFNLAIGSDKNKIVLNNSNSSFKSNFEGANISFELGQKWKGDGFYNYAHSFELSSHYSSMDFIDEKDEVSLTNLAYNLYLFNDKYILKPYIAVGIVFSILNAELKTYQQTLRLENDNFNLGTQLKIGAIYPINKKTSIGMEYKYLAVNTDVDKINGLYVYDDIVIKNRINSLSFKLQFNF